ncbi:SDR family NAD(P)-dependent oxidoreductase [Saccharopolyspora sp. WRP15-2]|uniref:SDR family NAD(P)-dependent oxidoreductase n=1 Tax=Saccharopolyspora oryzae TaxID=2997343 RepID=A0ABT4V4E6_9PSEU|nr:SDR family oxidoreductase [Saccharopolyspora oryzae]MDA3628828.1 SDR family NAD(P)-dependent oxidoreductase [Saccharopolyspora oryzae]
MSRRTALVTGASRGIGLGIAQRLAAAGYALTLSARKEEPLLHAASELADETGTEVAPVVGNLATEDDVRQLAAAHEERFGALDLLVLNGGVGSAGPVAETKMKTYDLVLNVNLRAQFLLIQQCLPMLRKAAAAHPSHGGKIVALASITGVAGEPGLAAYGASKAGLISLCETVTLEESVHGVTATAISPGYVDTDMTEWKRDELGQESMLSTADVAELVLAITRLSARAVVPNMVLTRAGEQIWRA